jgi:hypothetical protein
MGLRRFGVAMLLILQILVFALAVFEFQSITWAIQMLFFLFGGVGCRCGKQGVARRSFATRKGAGQFTVFTLII